MHHIDECSAVFYAIFNVFVRKSQMGQQIELLSIYMQFDMIRFYHSINNFTIFMKADSSFLFWTRVQSAIGTERIKGFIHSNEYILESLESIIEKMNLINMIMQSEIIWCSVRANFILHIFFALFSLTKNWIVWPIFKLKKRDTICNGFSVENQEQKQVKFELPQNRIIGIEQCKPFSKNTLCELHLRLLFRITRKAVEWDPSLTYKLLNNSEIVIFNWKMFPPSKLFMKFIHYIFGTFFFFVVCQFPTL